MADIADLAADELSLSHESWIAKIRQCAVESRVSDNMNCLNCGEKITVGTEFCDQDCQQDHEKRVRMRGGYV